LCFCMFKRIFTIENDTVQFSYDCVTDFEWMHSRVVIAIDRK